MKRFLAIMLVFGMLMLSGCGSMGVSGESNSDNTQKESESQGATEEQVLVDNEAVKVTFMEIFEAPGLVGTCYLRLLVENKSDKTVTVSLKDSYVNDTAQMIGSGVPMTLAPGKNSQTPFFFGYGNLGISSKDEIEKIEFKVWLWDENFDTVETEPLVVEFKK